MEQDYIGRRVAAFRAQAGLTQTQLADLIGKSQGYVSQIENGTKSVTTRALLISLAEALKVPTTALTTAKPAGRPDAERPLHDAVPNIRAGIDGVYDGEIPPGELTVDRLMQARMNCDYLALANLGPTLLNKTLQVAEISNHPRAHQDLAKTAFTLSMALRPLGYVDLATRLAERAQYAAGHAEDPVTAAAAEFARSQCALSAGVRGLRDRSLALAGRAADAIQNAPTVDGQAWYGLLHLQAALAAGSLNREALAIDHLDEADRAIAHVTGDPWRMEATPENAAVWRAAVLVEGSDPGQAIEVARRVDRTALRTPQRRSHLMIHYGRALLAAGRGDEAVRAFLEADAIAPAEVRGRSAVREAVGGLLRQAQRRAGSADLRRLATVTGVDPLVEPQ